MEHGRIITPNFLGEHKVITAEQQFLGLILCFFMYLKWPWLLRLFAVLLYRVSKLDMREKKRLLGYQICTFKL